MTIMFIISLHGNAYYKVFKTNIGNVLPNWPELVFIMHYLTSQILYQPYVQIH